MFVLCLGRYIDSSRGSSTELCHCTTSTLWRLLDAAGIQKLRDTESTSANRQGNIGQRRLLGAYIDMQIRWTGGKWQE